MSTMTELALLDATAQAELVRKKELQPSDLVEAAIQRIERVNPKLNAVITTMYDQARKAVKGALPEGPFKGVPFLLKDLLATYAGVPMKGGSKFLDGFVPVQDSELVRRYKQAGFVVVGKTNTPEFGLVPTTEPRFTGVTHNPWHPERTCGGSSGGSASAVAAGMLPAAHGNDGGGSIRIPASCCGVFGLKPTRGRITLGPALGDMTNGLVCEHALTRTVRDSAAILDATAGPMPGDPYYAPPPERPYLKEVGASPGKLRIGFITSAQSGTPVHEDCIKAVHDAAALCTELGHTVEETALGIAGEEAISQAFIAVFAAGCTWSLDALAKVTEKKPARDLLEPGTWALYQLGQGVSACDYLTGWTMLQIVSRQIAQSFEKYDVLLTPTLAEPPLPLGTLDSTEDNPLAGLFRAAAFVPFTPLCNFTGQPAMSAPLYWSDDGLPIGTHFVGRYADEATLFRLAAQLEQARPWAKRRPPVSAFD